MGPTPSELRIALTPGGREDTVTPTIGDRSWDELDTRASRIPSVVPTFVPDRVQRRRQRLRALREALPVETPDAGAS
jgi:hypothetical protein